MKTIKLLLAAMLSMTAWTGASAQGTTIDFDAAGNYHLFKIAEGESYPKTALEHINKDDPWGFYRYKVANGTYTRFTTYDTNGSNGTAAERGTAWYTEKEYCFVSSTGHYHSTVDYSPAIIFTAPADGIYFATITVWRDKANKTNLLYLRSRFLDKGDQLQCDKENYIFEKAYGTTDIDHDNGQVPQTLDFYIRMTAGQRFTFETESYSAGSNSDGRTHISNLAVASCSSAGNLLTLEDAQAYQRFYDTSNMVDVTYVVKDGNGNTLETIASVPTKVGTKITTLPSNYQRPFTQYSEVDVTISEATTIEFTATWNGPFEISAITEDMADAKWYNMTIRSTFSVFMDVKEPYSPKKDATAAEKMGDEYQWAFSGDAYNGIVLYNKAKGAGWTLAKDGENTVMREGTYSWTIGKNNDGFTLRETSSDINVINHRNQVTLGLWKDGSLTSDGSTLRVSEVPEDFSQFVIEEIAPWCEGQYFVFTDAAKAAIGYQESYKTACTQEQYEGMKTVLDAKQGDISNFVLPGTGYYRLKNYRTAGRYLQYGEKDGVPFLNTEMNPEEAIGNIVKLTQVSDNLYTVSVGGLYATAPEMNVENELSRTGATFKFVINKPGRAALTTGEQYGALHYSSESKYHNNSIGWKDTSDGSQWFVEDATIPTSIDITIGEAGYATLNALWPVEIPSGVKAYVGVINAPKTHLALNEITGTIPAATPVVLAGDAGTYTFNFADDADAVPNDLKGTYKADKPEGALTLQMIDDILGFYTFTGETIAANKAYITLPADATVKSLGIVFGDATSIKNVQLAGENNIIYNLTGQRVNNAQKGIYIVGGKKVVK